MLACCESDNFEGAVLLLELADAELAGGAAARVTGAVAGGALKSAVGAEGAFAGVEGAAADGAKMFFGGAALGVSSSAGVNGFWKSEGVAADVNVAAGVAAGKSDFTVDVDAGVALKSGAFGVSSAAGLLMRSKSERGGCVAGVLDTAGVAAGVELGNNDF